ncbi:MAG: alpha/beta hydrolase [Opitutales bacterium]
MPLFYCQFKSRVLELDTEVPVILPQAGKAPHPVLFLLHGLSDNETTWLRRTSIERYADEHGIAVVMPGVNRSFYLDETLGLRYGTYCREEVPERVRSWFPLSEKREDTFVAGLSMGGYGAFLQALTHPGRYAAAASLGGALDLTFRRQRLRADWQAGGQPEKPPLLAMLDQLSERVDPRAYNLFHLADRVAARPKKDPRPRLYAWCGTEDFLHQDNLNFRDHVSGLDLPFTYEEGPGDHSWGYWDTAIQRALDWFDIPGDPSRKQPHA